MSLADLGRGCPALLVGYGGISVLLEVKGEKGKLNPMQEAWHNRWTGEPVVIVRTIQDVEKLIVNMTTLIQAFGKGIAENQEIHD